MTPEEAVEAVMVLPTLGKNWNFPGRFIKCIGMIILIKIFIMYLMEIS